MKREAGAMSIKDWKQWVEMNEEEREGFLNLIRHVMAKVSDPDDTDWHNLQRMDVYRHAVQSCIGCSDEDLLAEDALFDDDMTDRFFDHCDRGYRRGMTEDACAGEWLGRAQ